MTQSETEKPVVEVIGGIDFFILFIVCEVGIYLWLKAYWTLLVPFVILFPWCCVSLQKVKLYQNSMVIIRPLLLFWAKKTIPYDRIKNIEGLSGKFIMSELPFEMFVYVNGRKLPFGIPMPMTKQKKKKFKDFIVSKEIPVKWGWYGNLE